MYGVGNEIKLCDFGFAVSKEKDVHESLKHGATFGKGLGQEAEIK
jgi:hypothetical protein